jgi:hypothetical protein
MIGAATSGIVSPLAKSYKQGEFHGLLQIPPPSMRLASSEDKNWLVLHRPHRRVSPPHASFSHLVPSSLAKSLYLALILIF